MKFHNRQNEMKRLDRLISAGEGVLGVLWGRRRVGKSRLLVEWCTRHKGLYLLADQSAPSIQRAYMAQALTAVFPGFDGPVYPDWRTLLRAISDRAKSSGWKGPLIFDEFPYLVLADPSLPSVVQGWVDRDARDAGLVVILAGSSQHMMQGLVLDQSAPLYGRAREAFALRPLDAGWIKDALKLPTDRQAVEAYAVWGGVPRYWELAEHYGPDLDRAVAELALDPSGILHNEPDRLLMEETPPAISLRPVLDAIGMGAHRVSEIGGRLALPATSLGHPLNRLQQLDLVRRELPFGAPEKSGRKSLYKIVDPFFRFWFRVVAPHRGELMQMPAAARVRLWKKFKPQLVSEIWEDLCRQSIGRLAGLPGEHGTWGPARRYWDGNEDEWDVVSRQAGTSVLLIGEAKWTEKALTPAMISGLGQALMIRPLPPPLNADQSLRALFVPEIKGKQAGFPFQVFTARDVLGALK